MFRMSLSAALIAAAAMLMPQNAEAQRVRAGVLTCDVSGGLGLIIGSQKSATCLFVPSVGGPQEVYTGTITKFGLDIGATTGGQMLWSVFAETTRGAGFLSGTYVGAGAEATIAAGLGANVLVGGSRRTVALQPVSVQGQTGLSLALGVTELQLRPGR